MIIMGLSFKDGVEKRVSLLERCPHFRGCYVQASMESGPEDVSLLADVQTSIYIVHVHVHVYVVIGTKIFRRPAETRIYEGVIKKNSAAMINTYTNHFFSHACLTCTYMCVLRSMQTFSRTHVSNVYVHVHTHTTTIILLKKPP